MNRTHEREPFLPGRSRFAAGDPIRAIAALGVFVYHAAFTSLLTRHHDYVAAYGPLGRVLLHLDLGLYLFFALSGYLVLRPFVHAAVEGIRPLSYARYLRRRLIRIAIPFWAAFGFLYVRHLIFPATTSVEVTSGTPLSRVLAVFFLVQDWFPSRVAFLVGPAWTLAVEIQFYVLAPIVLLAAVKLAARWWRKMDRDARAYAIAALAVLAGLASVAIRGLLPDTIPWKRTFPALAVAFMPGLALSALEHSSVARAVRRAGSVRALSWLFLITGALLVIPYHRLGGDAHEFIPTLPAVRPALASLVAGCVLAAVLVREWAGVEWRVLHRSRVLAFMGARSYSFYLLHVGLLFEFAFLARHSTAPVRLALISCAAFPVTLAASYVFHRYVEAPAMFFARSGMWRLSRPDRIEGLQAPKTSLTAPD